MCGVECSFEKERILFGLPSAWEGIESAYMRFVEPGSTPLDGSGVHHCQESV